MELSDIADIASVIPLLIMFGKGIVKVIKSYRAKIKSFDEDAKKLSQWLVKIIDEPTTPKMRIDASAFIQIFLSQRQSQIHEGFISLFFSSIIGLGGLYVFNLLELPYLAWSIFLMGGGWFVIDVWFISIFRNQLNTAYNEVLESWSKYLDANNIGKL